MRHEGTTAKGTLSDFELHGDLAPIVGLVVKIDHEGSHAWGGHFEFGYERRMGDRCFQASDLIDSPTRHTDPKFQVVRMDLGREVLVHDPAGRSGVPVDQGRPLLSKDGNGKEVPAFLEIYRR